MSDKKTKKEKYGYNYIQITVTDEFKKEIEKYSRECGFSSNSNFIRACIREKIRGIENPMGFRLNAVDPMILEELKETNRKIDELKNLTKNRNHIGMEMNNILDLIRKFSVRDLSKEAEIIENLLKAHKQLSVKKISDNANLDERLVIEIIANNDNIELDVKTGRFKLKNG